MADVLALFGTGGVAILTIYFVPSRSAGPWRGRLELVWSG